MDIALKAIKEAVMTKDSVAKTNNNHIRTDTSAKREAHLRVLAETDNTLRDAMAMLDEQRRKEKA